MRAQNLLTLFGLAGVLAAAGALAQSQEPTKSSHETQPSAPKQDDSMQNMPGMDMGHMNMGNMNMGHDEQDHVESGAMNAMQPGRHMEGSHMHMTSLRPSAPGDRERADAIVSQLRPVLEKY